MYLGIFKNTKELHEILGLVFVGIVVLHVFVNWNSMKSYFNKKAFYSACIVTTIVSAVFIIKDSMDTSVSPKRLVFQSVYKGDLKDVLKIMKIDYDNAKIKLQKEYNKNLDDYNSIQEIGKSIEQSPFDTISILIKK